MASEDRTNVQSLVVKSGEGEPLSVIGNTVKFLCRAQDTGQRWSLLECVLPEGSGPPPHDHPWDEAYYVVEGRVRFMLAGRDHVLEAGDFVYASSGTLHSFTGISKQPARVIIFDAPAHTEAFFREVSREVVDLPRDLVKMPEIGARHRIHFIAPEPASGG